MSQPLSPDDFKRLLDEVGAEVKANTNPFVPMHVIFQQMREAGFSENQACKIIGYWCSSASA